MGTRLLTQTPTSLPLVPDPLPFPVPHIQISTPPWSQTHSDLPSFKLTKSCLSTSFGFAQSCGSAHRGGVPRPSSSHATHCRTDSSWSPSPVQSVRGVWWWTQLTVHYWHANCRWVQTWATCTHHTCLYACMHTCTHTHVYKHKYTHRHIWCGLKYLPN